MHTVSAMFDSSDDAQRAIAALRDAGARDSALSVIGRDGETQSTTDLDGEDNGGSMIRGLLGGGALGAGLGVAALAIPGVGPLAAAGAIAAAAVPSALGIGAAAGAVAGSLNEALMAHGVSQDDARYYEGRLGQGGVFVSVDTYEAGIDPETALGILHRHGGHNASRQTAASGY
jgi:hypothetical protein